MTLIMLLELAMKTAFWVGVFAAVLLMFGAWTGRPFYQLSDDDEEVDEYDDG